MTADATVNDSLAELVQTQGSCTAPLDAAVEYLRVRGARVFPLYVLAMAPHAIVVKWLLDAIVAEQRDALSGWCALLTLATVWRWIWLARIQAMVQSDLGVLPPRPEREFWKRLIPILQVRLVSNIAVTWGGLIVFPAFYGLFIGSFAAPLFLENPGPVLPNLGKSISWIHNSTRRLMRITLAMTIVAVLILVAAFVAQLLLTSTVLPSLLGLDTADLGVTLNSWAWRLTVFYFLFLILDGYWTVASVLIYYDSQSRRLATDLKSRLRNVTEGRS